MTQSDLNLPSTNPFTLPALPLLKAPTNTENKRLFVAATRMNDGKTTTCLGLFAALQAAFPRVGFIKPIGQRFVEVQGHKVDEDSVLLDTIYKVRVPIESMSPVAIDGSFTRRYLKNPADMLPKLEDQICRAFDRVSWEKDFTLIEGTGHAGVGSVFDLSNARVAKLLKAKAIIVCPGGIGRPIDEIALNKALFDQVGVEVVGAILNKVEADKMDMITEYAGRGLKRLGVPLLGVLPIQQVLARPNLAQIAEHIDGRWLNASANAKNVRVGRLVVGAMAAKGIVEHLRAGTVIITPGDRDDILLAAISSAQLSPDSRVAGIILTNDIEPHAKLRELLTQTDIPIMMAAGESYTVTSKINSMTVKTQPGDSDKIPVIKKLIQEHVGMENLLAAIG
ncbi:phosphotransacetylase family protein [Synoicihabitans lomoniglobus]|uniref:AAA family ATPase n=1 Tax=Synoicihabitans lomoniglobus TaxID=2909285 RepID=A0AAF0I3K3_9BACT|nr:AAA family ATPase [Opitutaceae bacterium LMO-M01]WED66194.1 AAA family ATPase [Opitutaceae bacterium LMO-M01]